MYNGCISSCPQGTKNIVFVSGSWWALTHGECSEEASRLVCICSWALAKSERRVLRSLMRISQRYVFSRLPLGRIWMCCHFWLSSACDVEAPLGCCLAPLFPSLCSVWAMVLSGGEEHHLTNGGLPRLKGGLNLWTPAWEPNRWNGKSGFSQKQPQQEDPASYLCLLCMCASADTSLQTCMCTAFGVFMHVRSILRVRKWTAVRWFTPWGAGYCSVFTVQQMWVCPCACAWMVEPSSRAERGC